MKNKTRCPKCDSGQVYMKNNDVLKCRQCGFEGKVKIKRPIDVIYTAGKMLCDWEDISDTWRGKLEKAFPDIQWLHPTIEGCDHSGIMPDLTVDNDLSLIEQSDLVIGFFDQPELHGTVTEILYAASIGKDVGLVFVKKNLNNQRMEFHLNFLLNYRLPHLLSYYLLNDIQNQCII